MARNERMSVPAKKAPSGRVGAVPDRASRNPDTGQRFGARSVVPKAVADEGTLTNHAYRTIEELIVTLELPPGSVLSEQSLALRLETGRTPVREALQRLCRDGLVLILPRRGILVSEINPGTQLRLLEVRRLIERLMASTAASRATDSQCRAFSAVARGMLDAARKTDGLAFMRLDRELNVLVCEAAKNEFATRAMSLMHGLSRRFWYQHYRQAADLPFAAELHADLADAISRRRVDEAAVASDRLLDYIEDFTRKTIDG